MNIWGAIIGSVVICHLAALTAQATNVEMSAPSGVSVSYDPFTGFPGLEDVTFELISSGHEASLPARLIIKPEFGTDFQLTSTGVPLELEIVSNAGGMTTGRYEMPVMLSPNASQQLAVTFKVPAGQYADAGQADINLIAELVDAATGQPLASEHVLQINCDVPSRAQTNFAGTTPGYANGIGTAHIDFGHIIPGDSRQINFQVRGNANVMVMISSENNGKMVNQEDALVTPVGYSIIADGIPSDLSAPLNLFRLPEKTLTGSSYPLKVTLDPMSVTPFAGIYKDIISIDVTPQ